MKSKESYNTTEYMTEHAHTLNSIYISGCFNCAFLDLLCLCGIRSSQSQTINQVLTSLLSGQTGCFKAGSPTPSYPVLTHQTHTPRSSSNQGQVLSNQKHLIASPRHPAPGTIQISQFQTVYSAWLFFLAENPARDSSLDFHLLTTAWLCVL